MKSKSSKPCSQEQQEDPEDVERSMKKVNFPKRTGKTQSEQDFASASLSTPAAGRMSKEIEHPSALVLAATSGMEAQSVDGRQRNTIGRMATKLGDTDVQIQNTLANALASSRDDGGLDPAIVA